MSATDVPTDQQALDGPVQLPDLDDDAAIDRLVDEAEAGEAIREGEVFTGRVVEIGEDTVTVALGAEHRCAIDLDEFMAPDGSTSAQVGDEVDVYVEGFEGDDIVLSKEIADKLRIWDQISDAARGKSLVHGKITGRTKGGLVVDIGVRAFLPGSQVDVRPSRKLDGFIGKESDFEVIKFDKGRGNIVVSRRAIMEKERAELKEETLNNLRPGAVLNGIVKNLTDYGCFVDLGGIDGLLHVTDMSWGRVGHPREVVKVGDEVTVQVLHFDSGTEKVKLGMKQITEDPWLHIDRKFREGQIITGKVVSLTDYGAFVEIEDGVEGMVHVSELSWTRRVKHPKEEVKVGETVQARVLDIDTSNRRISLSIKAAQANPWNVLQERLPVGTRIKAKVRNVTNFGVFLGVEEGIDGLVHVSDLTWTGNIKDPRDHYKVGDELDAVVLNIDPEAERLSLGIKQLSQDPWHGVEERFPIGQVVEGKVVKVLDFGAIVELEPNVEGLVHISELREDHVEDIREEIKVGDTVRAKVINLDPEQRKMGLSVKRAVEAEAASDYGRGEPATRTTIGDLIKEKMDVSKLPPGKSSDDE